MAGTRRRILPGSGTFRKNWTDLVVVPGSSQYNMLVGNIEKSVSKLMVLSSQLFPFLVFQQHKIYCHQTIIFPVNCSHYGIVIKCTVSFYVPFSFRRGELLKEKFILIPIYSLRFERPSKMILIFKM